jgi:hypothetical protein
MRHLLLLLGIIVLFSSCSKSLTPFSQRLYDRYDWTENELSKIQFYLSDDIVLHRVLGSKESKITEGKIRIIDGVEVEEIIFKKGTPGVFVFSPKANRFGISFEEDDDSFLMFGPNPKQGGKYVLLAKEWQKERGKVTYKGKVYETARYSSFATLMVDLKKAEKNRYKSKTVSGRKIK